MEIRQATRNDLREIAEIESICFPLAEAATKEAIYERFEVFGENFLVATEGEKIVGFINGCTPYLHSAYSYAGHFPGSSVPPIL